MPQGVGARLGLLAAVLLLSACASGPPLTLPAGAPAIELTEVPFFPQEDYHCGPAALAEVLQWTGVDVTPAALAPRLMIPARYGTLQIELVAQTRAQGRVPYQVPGDLGAVYQELAAGHPVLILQNLALDWSPLWHYAVVVGLDPARREVILRSGREPRRVVDATVFENTWARADKWAMVALPPAALPVTVEPAQVRQAAIALEQLQHWPMAEAVYHSAARRWPDQAIFQLGYANARYAQGAYAEAEAAYRVLIAAFPQGPAAYNNLAWLLARQQRWDEAEALIDQGLIHAGPLRDELEHTQRQIRCGRAGTCR